MGSAVSARYTAPFAFGGTIHRLDVQLAPERKRDGAANAAVAAAAAMARQ